MVMFFMATTTFVKEERTAAVKLPTASAQSAKPVEGDIGSDYIYVSVNERGDLLLNPLDPGFDRYPDGKIEFDTREQDLKRLLESPTPAGGGGPSMEGGGGLEFGT